MLDCSLQETNALRAQVGRGSTLQEAVSPPRRCTWRCRSCAAPGASPVQMGRPPTPTGP